jgi:hypothetical protein
VAGRVPAALPMPELPAAGQPWGQPISPAASQPIWTAEPMIPRQRVEEDYRYPTPLPAARPESLASEGPTEPVGPSGGNGSALRRRVPGSQLPADTGTRLAATPPSPDDAVAARAAFDAFEAGITQAHWDVAETDMSSPPSAGHAPLARRVPGATLPADEPDSPPPAAAPVLDPDAARALMEQFEYGVALALNETQPQPEGQPR